MTSLGQLTASIAHEINQPLAAVVINANACVRWLARDAPDLEEARAAARRSVESATRASETINRVRQLFKKGAPQRELVDVNEAIQEIIALVRGELARHSISVRTELAADLPRIMGDRVQLQQLIMNLMINGIDAMKGVDGARELFVRSTGSSMRSSPPRFREPAWACPSAAPSPNRTEAACGLPITLRAARSFPSPFPPKCRAILPSTLFQKK